MKTHAKRKSKPSRPRPAPARSSGKFAPLHKRLLGIRADILKTVSKKSLPGDSETGDSMDQASVSAEKELIFELSDGEHATLDQVEAALRKIEKGLYGLCDSCRKPIPKARLKAMPFARYCVSCQNISESASAQEAGEELSELTSTSEDKDQDFEPA